MVGGVASVENLEQERARLIVRIDMVNSQLGEIRDAHFGRIPGPRLPEQEWTRVLRQRSELVALKGALETQLRTCNETISEQKRRLHLDKIVATHREKIDTLAKQCPGCGHLIGATLIGSSQMNVNEALEMCLVVLNPFGGKSTGVAEVRRSIIDALRRNGVGLVHGNSSD